MYLSALVRWLLCPFSNAHSPMTSIKHYVLHPGFLVMLTLSLLPVSLPTIAEQEQQTQHQFTYAWPYLDASEMKPRGGTTRGTELTLATEPGARWQALQADNITPLERDRRAILAMAGAYRASFDFLETAGFELPYTNQRPYQSWGTEYVYVIQDDPEFISLQHILVMRVQLDDGSQSEPMVIKHWRQDWTYEDRSLHGYVGHNTWQQEKLGRKETRGTWSQAVYQVDDSPRYESVGKWIHLANYSSWQSRETWRPLPRREFSVRDDYDALIGTNRHTITPLGWIHEEDNLKAVINPEHKIEKIIAREAGFNRYERIEGFDFSAGDEYWHRTAPFWQDVVQAWTNMYRDHDKFSIKSKVDDNSLIGEMFGYAARISEDYDRAAGQAFIERTFEKFVEGQ